MRKYKLWMNDIVFDRDHIFFSAGQFNGLFRAKIYNGKAEFIGFFPNDTKRQARLHGDAFRYKDEILFLPDLSDYFSLYHITAGSFESIPFPNDGRALASMEFWPKVVTGILAGSCVYAFGTKYPYIICYDFETKKLKRYDANLEQLKLYGYKEGEIFFLRDVCQIGNSIFIRTYTDNVIAEFDIEAEKIIFHRVGKKLAHIVCGDSEKICFLEEDASAAYVWNRHHDLLQTIKVGNELKEMQQKYSCSIFFTDKMWLFPYLYGSIAIVGSRDGMVETMGLPIRRMNNCYPADVLNAVWFRKEYNGKLYFMSVLENKLYCFDKKGNKELCEEICADRTDVIQRVFQKSDFCELRETTDDLWSVQYDFIDAIMFGDWGQSEKKSNEVNYGKAIYDYLS